MKKFIILILPLIIFSIKPSVTRAYDEAYSHPYLTKLIINQWQKESGLVLTEEEQAQIITGSQNEDNPSARSLNHVYNPLNQQSMSIDNLWLAYTTPDWLTDKTKQNEPIFNGSFTWDEGLKAYKLGDRPRALTILGHSLHLLEDMAMPAHTRNDEHLEGDSYEAWIKEQNSLGGHELSWDSQLLHQVSCSKAEDCLRDLAKFTNANFFSRDTINDPNFVSPKNKVIIGADGYARANGRIVAWWDKSTKTLIVNSQVFRANWRALTPELVSYGVKMITLFLTDEIKPLSKNKITPRLSEGGIKIKAEDDTLYLNQGAGEVKATTVNRWWPIIDLSQVIPREFLGASPTVFIPTQVAGVKITPEATEENKNETTTPPTDSLVPSGVEGPVVSLPPVVVEPPVVVPDVEEPVPSDVEGPTANFVNLALTYPETSWTLNWQGSDNFSASSDLLFDVDFSLSANAESGQELASDWNSLIASTTASSTVFSAPLADGAKVNFRVRATDLAGNIGAWQEATTTFIEPSRHNPLLYEKLEHLYHFSECSGTVAHDTIANSHITTKLPWINGFWDCGVEQDWQESNYLSANFSPLTTSELTLGFYMKDVSGSGTFSRNRLWLVDASQNYTILQIRPTTQNIRIVTNSPYDPYNFYERTLTAKMPLDHNWHSVILTVNKDYLALYIDGALAEQIVGDFSPARAVKQLIMVGENAPTQFDEIVLWSRSLSSEEIIAYYNIAKPLKP